ncbi:LAMI_0G03202g1_1 [Lachancea mirantina]|uniref:LAMI_0G03202g1_1 n=1 Tax=Lachancea mirantina TaxID=1230905 RepID=A0A1G4K833_9SACH|nr:LAMI_0G03202g1_1 [Lachancea mirantina]
MARKEPGGNLLGKQQAPFWADGPFAALLKTREWLRFRDVEECRDVHCGGVPACAWEISRVPTRCIICRIVPAGPCAWIATGISGEAEQLHSAEETQTPDSVPRDVSLRRFWEWVEHRLEVAVSRLSPLCAFVASRNSGATSLVYALLEGDSEMGCGQVGVSRGHDDGLKPGRER